MLCELAGELISAYLDDKLPSHEALSLEKHIKVCPTCAAQLSELREMRAMLASLEDLAPPPGFHAALHRRLVAAATVQTPKVASLAAARQKRWPLANRWVAAAAAAAVMAVSAGSYYLELSAHQGPQQVAMVDNGTAGPTNPNTDTAQPGLNAGGNAGSSQGGGTGKTDASGKQTGSAAGVTGPQAPGTTGGVTPPQPTKDDGVGLASRPTASGTSQPGGTTGKTGSVIEGPLVVYHLDVVMQGSFNTVMTRLVGINSDKGGTIETSGETLLNGSNQAAKLIVLRVPASQYQDAKAKVLAIAPTISVQDYGPLDVTQQANAIQETLNTLMAQEALDRAVLAQTADAAARQRISAGLTSVQQQIDDLQKQLETYYDQAQLATLQIMVVE